ncbi:MAG: GTP-binding protein [Candidatus Curtissbacteria bacterium]|nr:GTP-binding protein [Candidatus Curtissbacteria bacterium]
MNDIRNVAIIAHVDHGKTTLVDALLRQSKTHLGKEQMGHDLIMDSNELERERGITIFSKNASVIWKGTKINIIDTPGHADFGGEVERVLKMADGCLLLVDAKEGPMPQTRFVLKHALEMGHKVIVIVNKIDKSDARPDYVEGKIFDLFVELGADEDNAYFETIYASSKLGRAGMDSDLSKMQDISTIFDEILRVVPPPSGNPDKPLQMLITTISADSHKGRIATGRIYNGTLKSGQEVTHISRTGEKKKYRITSLITFEGLDRVEAQEAGAGDIAAISGIPDITIGETVADPQNPQALDLIDIEEPTINMTFAVNSSPFGGREGTYKTSRQIRERLYKELETDVALRVEDGQNGDPALRSSQSEGGQRPSVASGEGGWIVSGRGELHLAILIERLRREGYEFQVSRPRVIEKIIGGKKYIPFERIFIEVPEVYGGSVMQKMGTRHGQLVDTKTENGVANLEFIIATPEFFGYRSEFTQDTKGLGLLNASFLEYRPDPGNIIRREHGSLVAHDGGTTKSYGLVNAQDRGVLFINAGVAVYKGQVVGQNSRAEDIRINVCKEKNQTNMRSKGEDVGEHFNAPREMSLENALEYIDDTELVEVTPQNIRIRKIILDELEARRQARGLI